MKKEWQHKLKRFLDHIKNVKDDELYSADMINDLVKSEQIAKISLLKDQLTIETGKRFIRFTDSDIPPGLIIPLNGKMFEYAIYEIPLEGDVEVAHMLLKDSDSPKYEYISDDKLRIVIYYNDRIGDNPAVEQRMKLIAQHRIERFEKACMNYNNEAEVYNKTIESRLKKKVESEKAKRKGLR